MTDSRQRGLEQIGAAILEEWNKRREASQVEELGPQLNWRQPNNWQQTTVLGVPEQTRTKEELQAEYANRGPSPLKAAPPDYKASYDKIYNAVSEWIAQKTKPSSAQPDVPPTPAKPATAPKPAAAPAKPAFVPPKMMPDGVTPWLPNSKPHHIVPKKKGPEDLLNVTGQPPPTSSTPTKVPPGPRRQQQPDAEVGFTIGPDGRFRPVLQPQQQAPVEEIQPAETE